MQWLHAIEEAAMPRRCGVVARIELGILTALLGAGCGTTLAVTRSLTSQSLSEVNAAVEGREAQVTLAGALPAEPLRVKDVKVGPESSHWLELRPREEPRSRSVPTAALGQISVVNQERGGEQGLVIGMAVGGIGGALAGLLVASSESCPSGLEGAGCRVGKIAGPLIVTVVGAAAGAVSGWLIGRKVGQQMTIEFGAPEPKPDDVPTTAP
jgi:hypothetical protein